MDTGLLCPVCKGRIKEEKKSRKISHFCEECGILFYSPIIKKMVEGKKGDDVVKEVLEKLSSADPFAVLRELLEKRIKEKEDEDRKAREELDKKEG